MKISSILYPKYEDLDRTCIWMNIPLNCIIIPESVFVAIEEIYNLTQLHSVKRKQDKKAVCYG